jgi:4-amino-4-deoxy-L-arabinose transferase-like glycosyltransferase
MHFKKLLPIAVLTLILSLAAYLRLYRISDYMGFLGDEGRDVLIVKRMLIDKEFTLLGPITSVGLMHLGPAYYYFMAPFLLITQFDPIGPAVMVALFSLATILLIWKFCKEFLGTKTAIIAALFYSISPLVITYSHSSWNPNILPFFALLIVYSLLKAHKEKKLQWIVAAGASFGIAIQLHYVALVFIPISIVILLIFRSLPFIKSVLTGLVGTLVTFSPFIIFELRHQFINTQTIFYFVTRTGDAKTFALLVSLYKFWDLSIRWFWRLFTIESAEVAKFIFFLVIGLFIYLIKRAHDHLRKKVLYALLAWYVVGFGVLSFYAGSVYDYYLMFAFPLIFILIGLVFAELSKSLFLRIGTILLIVYFRGI